MIWQDGYLFWCRYRKQEDACFVFIDAPNTPEGLQQAEAAAKKTSAVEVQYAGFARRLVSSAG